MSVVLSEIQSDIIKDIALKEGFKDYELTVTSESKKGDGFLGIILFVNLNNGKKELNLALKSAHDSEVMRTKTPIVDAYYREIFLYENVFPAFRQFQTEYKVSDGFSAYAKIYGSSTKEYSECLLLENLKRNNYNLWNKKVPMNPGHLSSVFAEYGKLHATSLAMKNKKPEVYYELTKTLDDMIISETNKSMWRLVSTRAVQYGTKVVENNQHAREAMRKLLVHADNFYDKVFEVVEDRIVILHGDCWNNNMMFHYGDSQETDLTKPKKVCLLDWQLSRTGSPAVDLAYFFYVCAPKDELAQYKKYLRLYYNTVADELSKYSCNVEDIFPYELLESHWKKYFKFGALMSLLLIKIMLSEEGEVPDLEKHVGKEASEKTPDLFSNFGRVSEYIQRIDDILTALTVNGLL